MSVAAITALPPLADILSHQTARAGPGAAGAQASFAQMIEGGIDAVNTKVTAADSAVKSFVLDDTIPVHQVSFALEQARLSLELMLQVRGRLVEGYQQLMNMQL